MSNRELFCALFFSTWFFILLIWTLVLVNNHFEHKAEGEAKSAMIKQFQGLDVPPKYARFAEIVVTTTDVQLSMAGAKVYIYEGNNP